MRGMNRIVIVGRLGQEPELRVSKGNHPFLTFSVATSRSRRDGDGWVEETDWHDVKVFGDDAERASRRLRKGSVVAVDGMLVYETWTDDAGQKRRRPRIHAKSVSFVSDLKPAPAGEEAAESAESAEAVL
jgi:single-strand DNA-binding protein